MSLAAMLLRPSRRRHALGVLAVVLLSALAATPASQTLFGSFDKVQFDLAGALFPARSSRKVVVVSVDAKTVRELGVERIFQRPLPVAGDDDEVMAVLVDVSFQDALLPAV